MTGDPHALANIYHDLGLDDYARSMTPRILDYAQREHDWMGRRILVCGVGGGGSIAYLARHGYLVSGMDRLAIMHEIANAALRPEGLQYHAITHDIRDDFNGDQHDLVIAHDTFNDLSSLRDVEASLGTAHALLKPNRLLIITLQTIEGMARRAAATPNALRIERDDLSLIQQNTFDYERQTLHERYVVFNRADGEHWLRSDMQRILRAYPVQAIQSLLKRQQFNPVDILANDLQPYNPDESGIDRVTIIAQSL